MRSFDFKQIFTLMLLILLLVVGGIDVARGQGKVYADASEKVDGSVTNPSYAGSSDNSYTTMSASLLGGSSTIKLSFPVAQIVPANTTVYVKTSVSSINIKAYNQASPVTTTPINTIFNTIDGNYYIAITSPSSFNSITVEFPYAVLGPFTTYIFHAFYNLPNDCGLGLATSVTTSGISILGTNGVINPHKAIDNDMESAAEMKLGAVGVLATVNESVLFSAISNPGDAVRATFSIPPAFIASLSLLSNVSVQAYNGNTAVGGRQSLNNLLTLDLLGLIGNNSKYTFYYVPPGPFDRIEFTIGGVVSLDMGLNLWDVQRVPSPLIIETSPINIVNTCSSDAIISISNPQSTTTYKWYAAVTGGSSLNTGPSFTVSGLVPGINTYYIEASKPGCTNALRHPVQVKYSLPPTVSPIAGASSICVGAKTTLTSTSTIPGEWKSSAPSIASIGKTTGEITALAAGTTNIIYEVKDPLTNCSSTVTKSIEVNAPLIFTSAENFSICTHSPFTYSATSNQDGRATYSWSRAFIEGISNEAATGNTNIISETLINTTDTAIDVIYIFSVSIGGCADITKNVTVKIKPLIPSPHIIITSN